MNNLISVPYHVPVAGVSSLANYLSPLFGTKYIAAPLSPQANANGSRICLLEGYETTTFTTCIKVASYVLSAGIFPLLALLAIFVLRSCGDKFQYEGSVESSSKIGKVPTPQASKAVKSPSNPDTLFSQAEAIREQYKDTHYVLLHGQSSDCIFLSCLNKELERSNYSEQELENFEFLRQPQKNDVRGIEVYSESKQLMPDVCGDGPKDLLSVDACFKNDQNFESAKHFVINNPTSKRMNKLRGSAIEAMRKAFPNISDDRLKQALATIESHVPNQSHGNLFALCIPKEGAEKVLYPSLPFGVRYSSHEESPASLIQRLQNGERVIGPQRNAIQCRVFMPQVRPGNGQKIFLLSGGDKEGFQTLERKTREVVSALRRESAQ